VNDWAETVYGASFTLQPHPMLDAGVIKSKNPIAIIINGQLASNNQDTIASINLQNDSIQQQRIIELIKEKNRLYRYRLRPLNEAYIYLFRRHEMGHLAYEMDDLVRLVEEKEKEIKKLIYSHLYNIEIELIKPWSPPENYSEDEVPAFVPRPDIDAEIAAFHLDDDYEISLFAADPMIANPISINWDTRGRAWVATSSIYPQVVPGKEPNDKIVILEDTDKDGKADKHTVFADNLLIPHSVMPVPGGAYVTATTEFLFFEDKNDDGVADERRVVFDGFGNADVHHTIHGLQWMPWGDLHFIQSIYINSFIETAYGKRILNGSGIWSFRPETEQLDIFARGMINPWGEGLDKWGQLFATDGAGSSGINYIFPESAHATAVGVPKIVAGLNGGKPKLTAAQLLYSDHFPTDWQGSIITNDYRANRTVRYEIKPKESGYESKEVATIIRSDHRSYRPVDIKLGPDGALYIVDWYNPIINHGEVDFYHPIRDRQHGRIWRLTKKGSPLAKFPDLNKMKPTQLLDYLKSSNQFLRLQANRAFVEKKGNYQLVLDWLKRLPKTAKSAQNRLEGLWLLAALNYYDEASLLISLTSKNASERAAATRLLRHWKKQKEHLAILEKLVKDKHPQVRLEALHALREMGGLKAAEMAIKVLNHPMDGNLEFALDLTLRHLKEDWLPKIAIDKTLFKTNKNWQLYALLTVEDERILAPLNQLIGEKDLDEKSTNKAWQIMAKIGDASTKSKVLEKVVTASNDALLNTLANAPSTYNAIPNNIRLLNTLLEHEQLNIRKNALKLIARWKPKDFTEKVVQLLETSADMSEKLAAGKALVALEEQGILEKMATTSNNLATQTAATATWIEESPQVAASTAITLLNKLDAPELASTIFNSFRKLEGGADILTNALEGETLPENIANTGLRVIQSSGRNMEDLETAIREAGNIQPVGMQLTKIAKEQLLKDAKENGNIYRGRQIYRKPELLCGSCHQVDGEGGLVGPDLSAIGTFMVPTAILESINNPNTIIKQNYETVLITKKNGEIISGMLHRKTDNATLIRQANNEIIEIPTSEIAETDASPVSLMPAGLTRNLSRDELKDLLAYLMSLGKG
jgi:putative heme-binding domain-containing protein